MYIYKHSYIYTYTYICIQMYMYMYIYIHIFIYIHTYIHLCMYKCILSTPIRQHEPWYDREKSCKLSDIYYAFNMLQ